MNGFAAAFSALSDPRRPNARQHKLLDILAIAFCACLCGAESCVDRADFAEAQEDVLREFLDLEGGPPSPDTFSRVFRAARSGEFGCLLSGLSRFLRRGLPRARRYRRQNPTRAHERAAGVSPLQLVSAFAAETRLT